jgi:non-canonical purine NTP pyrophosphatase (RdgB/HAM1 family)
MKELIFVTTNTGKVASLQTYMDRASIDAKISGRPLDIVEIQADTALEVARAKATEAFRRLGQPLVVDDSEFRIAALGGFPGPYQKYMVETLGPEGVVRLMEGHDDRSAYFVSNLIYVDAEGTMHEFADDPFNVTIVARYDDTVPEYAWGPLGKICIMEGCDKVQSLMSAEERAALDAARPLADAYEKFVAWYKERDV